jgi:hypothetical protein
VYQGKHKHCIKNSSNNIAMHPCCLIHNCSTLMQTLITRVLAVLVQATIIYSYNSFIFPYIQLLHCSTCSVGEGIASHALCTICADCYCFHCIFCFLHLHPAATGAREDQLSIYNYCITVTRCIKVSSKNSSNNKAMHQCQPYFQLQHINAVFDH